MVPFMPEPGRPLVNTHYILPIVFCLVLVLPATTPAVELQPIPETDLSGLETLGRDAILEARRQLTQEQDPTAAGQAEVYARLAALYQRFAITGAAEVAWANTRALRPRDYRWPYYQGWLALETGHIDRALAAFGEARRLKPDYAPLDLRMGQAWLAVSRLQQAQEAFQRAAEHTGLRAAALYYLGQIAVLQRDYPRAEHLLGEALNLAPAATGIHYPLAQAYRGLGRRDEAREQLSRFKPGEPQADDPLVEQLQQVITRADEFFNTAMRAVKGRDYPEALRQFEQGLAIDPDNDNARISYGRALYLAGRGKEASSISRAFHRPSLRPLSRVATHAPKVSRTLSILAGTRSLFNPASVLQFLPERLNYGAYKRLCGSQGANSS
jgi:tetratricopeptide (TPR) repeat protein